MTTNTAPHDQERFRSLLMIHAHQLRTAAQRTCLREDRAALLATAVTLETMAYGVHADLAVHFPDH